LYDNFGNRGQPSAEGNNRPSEAPNTSNAGTGGPDQTQASEGGINTSPQTPAQSCTPTANTTASNSASLATHFGQLHLNVMRSDNVSGDANKKDESASAPSQESLTQPITMDLDGEASGWTLVDNERVCVFSDNFFISNFY